MSSTALQIGLPIWVLLWVVVMVGVGNHRQLLRPWLGVLLNWTHPVRAYPFLALVLFVGCGGGTREPSAPRLPGDVQMSAQERDARRLIDQLARHQWLEATKPFDAKMTEVMPPAKLEDAWTKIESEVGPWVAVESSKVETKDNRRSAMVIGQFARHRKLVCVVFDGEQRIAGLWFGPVPEDLEATAKALIEALARGDAITATKDFNASMRSALPADKLGVTWKGIVEQAGDFVGIEGITVQSESGIWRVLATCKFSRVKLDAKVAFAANNEVAGLFFLPHDAPLP